jgi:uracil-DNA glycosylase
MAASLTAMTTRLPPSATPKTFARAIESAFKDTATRVAGGDGVIDPQDAKNALASLGEHESFARSTFEKLARGTKTVSVSALVDAQAVRAQKAAERASGPDGRLSKADAAKLPADLRLAFHALRNNVDAPFTKGLAAHVPPAWRGALASVSSQIDTMSAFVERERKTHTVYPPAELTFNALAHTPPEKVKVVIIGQDPYHGPDEAHGLSFSVPDGVKVPPSLKNIMGELERDLGVPPSSSGNLTAWAERGVLLLNTALTVRKDEPGSHSGQGWEAVTDAVLKTVNESDERVVFLLLGADAQKLGQRIDTSKHTIVARSHPSPLSVRRNFAGTKPFSEINAALVAGGRMPIDWKL